MDADNAKFDSTKLYNKMRDLELKTEKLSNGQRYAAINEIDKALVPLKNNLKFLEHELHERENTDIEIKGQYRTLQAEITNLENVRSDLDTRIKIENEHTRDILNEKIINHVEQKISPINAKLKGIDLILNEHKTDMTTLTEEIKNLRKEITEQNNKNSARTKTIITTISAIIVAITTITLFLEPALRLIANIFF